MDGIAIEIFQETELKLSFQVDWKLALPFAIPPIHTSYHILLHHSYTRFQYINHSLRVPHKYIRYLLVRKLIRADTTEVITTITTNLPNTTMHAFCNTGG